ncbi:Enoyl-CoA hydratase [Novosphingobium sp. CF614]|uniref:crotonase/enoyl-CoA hydratase family protein n=1 Tax=Novosphingobium sp. CF614 TaxID=1884364 RepID=UPI0008EBEFF4|nr:crotonase/enoyl-CoA hydratase family protein [Novosphingobium sp. CF614]SFF77394.1 Enoyl-CoA hydratase [Novosphingobium sp. CF614]
MGYETIRYDMTEGIATITLDRGDGLNAMNKQMTLDLLDVFDVTDDDDAVRAVIVTGAGERSFCVGADLSSGGETFDFGDDAAWSDAGSPLRADGTVDYSHPGARDGGGLIALRIFASRKPIIAAFNGVAAGVGTTMTLPMDFRLASDKARFGLVFARRGIVPEAASSWFLPRLIGIGKALEWCYSGRIVPADEALKAGLLRSIHAPDELIPAARALARELTAHGAPVSIAMTRRMMWAGLAMQHPMEAHRMDSRAVWIRGRSGDAFEGVTSFLEKRDARFPDAVSQKWAEFAAFFDEPDYY